MSHNFPCSPQGGKFKFCCIGKTILGGILFIIKVVGSVSCTKGSCT